MVYETFQETITSKLRNRLGDGYRLILQKIPKNNGLILDGLSIRPKDQDIAPTIYLNHYYERFREGRSMDSLVEEIIDIYRENSPVIHVDFSMLGDFSRLRDKVVYRLIHTGANQKLLEDVPSIPFLDLSIVFYLYLEQNTFGQMTALIHQRHLSMWNTNVDELYSLACANTSRLLPAELKTMNQVIKDMAKEHLGYDYREEAIDQLLPSHEESPMYVLSNSFGIHGACAILYPCVMECVADTAKKDLVILPSSVHEVLLLPYDNDMNLDELSNMVHTINQEQVPLEDRLSDHIYFYSRDSDQVVISPGSSSALAS